MDAVVRQAVDAVVKHLEQLARDPKLAGNGRIVVERALSTYQCTLKENRLAPDLIHLTVDELLELIGENLELLRLLVHPTFLGLFNTLHRPKVIFVGNEIAIDVEAPNEQARPKMIRNFTLEVLYLPLLRKFAAQGPMVAHIAGTTADPTWAQSSVVFADDPNAYYKVTDDRHTWSGIAYIMRGAKLGGLKDAHVNERNCRPVKSTSDLRSTNRVPNGLLRQVMSALAEDARVLIIHGQELRKRDHKWVTEFLKTEEEAVNLTPWPKMPRVQTLTRTGHDGILRRVIKCRHCSGPGLRNNEQRDEVVTVLRDFFETEAPQ